MCTVLFEDGCFWRLWRLCNVEYCVSPELFDSYQRSFHFFSALILVEKVANESQKTPRDVVMMENFHHIFATLSRLKISCLEAEKKEAKQKYTDHLQSYVIYSLGQPLEKLNVSRFSFGHSCFWSDSIQMFCVLTQENEDEGLVVEAACVPDINRCSMYVVSFNSYKWWYTQVWKTLL